MVSFLKLLQILMFNFIFKNNTSDSTLHSNLHRGCVLGLGAITLLYQFVYSRIHRDRNYFKHKVRLSVFLAVLFQAVGWYTDTLTTPSRFWNFMTMFFEAILVEQTV